MLSGRTCVGEQGVGVRRSYLTDARRQRCVRGGVAGSGTSTLFWEGPRAVAPRSLTRVREGFGAMTVQPEGIEDPWTPQQHRNGWHEP